MESHARELDLDRLTKMNRGLKYINVSAQVLRSITGIFLNNLSNKIPMPDGWGFFVFDTFP
jgi:hypothetical protein